MEHHELLDLAKQLTKVKNAKKPYYFFFVLEGFDEKPALYIERKPSDARQKGMAAKSRARKKSIAHGRVELRSRRAVFINETSMNSKRLMKAFKSGLCKEAELRSVAQVLKKSDVVTVEEDLALTMEATGPANTKKKKLEAPKKAQKLPKKKKKNKALTSRAQAEAQQERDENNDQEEVTARWHKLLTLVKRRVRILERKTARIRPTETLPPKTVQALNLRVQKLREATDRGEHEYTTGHPKIAIQTLVKTRDDAQLLREDLEALPTEASVDSVDMELGWVKVIHKAWSLMLDKHVLDLEIPLARLCAPMTLSLDRLLMSSSIEELHEQRLRAIEASSRVDQELKHCPFRSELDALPENPLTAKDGLLPTLRRITDSLAA